jgi:DNA-binding transcriptional MerR regulator
MTDKAPEAFRTISEVAEDLDLPQHVLRFWETRFSQIRPMKRGGGRRYYRPEDIALVKAIRELLYGQGYTIRGVQRLLKERGVRGIVAGGPMPPPEPTAFEGPGSEEDGDDMPLVPQPDEFEPSPGRDFPAHSVVVEPAHAPVFAGPDPALIEGLKTLRDELRACAGRLAAARGA